MKTITVMYVEFYREDGSWIGAQEVGAEVFGEFAQADKVVFEGRVELVVYDENGNVIF